MSTLRQYFSVLILGAVVAMSGCDVPTEPPAAADAPELGLLGTATGLLRPDKPVDVLERTVSLESDISVTRTIGPDGGVIHIPEAGLKVSFPEDALAEPTEIRVTAPAGDLVGYHFEPHGLEFERSVTIRQDLSETEGAGLLSGLSGAYFTGDLKPKVLALEILELDLLNKLLARFQIDHFSGYVIATE